MLDTRGKLQSLEGVLKDVCLKLGVTEAAHIHEGTNEKRQRKLLKLALAALRELDDESAAMSMEPSSLSHLDRVANALAYRMGVYVPPELR